jgi:hypothetical protein
MKVHLYVSYEILFPSLFCWKRYYKRCVAEEKSDI